MSKKTIVLASDHAGYELKDSLKEDVIALGYDVLDLGTNGPDSVDYPDFGTALAKAIQNGDAETGILVCGSGIGISIAANRHAGIRAALCHDETLARLSREHNDANVLVLGARTTGIEVAKACLNTFLNTEFAGGRHQRRVEKLG
ncbi:ribose 5-phosphate isomerase B [Kiloniella laminariae]|uniref:Ribose 5-phosphate isomerase B n=1 Tax=Kiloniella laminariae TaxID=454162 RepID=A0ABT4LGB1_9PROT|nr:ribose 5-phosphate isomerase B [Kiloniella laminariae]MCZ4280143.1 ribose 5-phosphate isomerase B [Kiloniella laminariae]